MSFVDLDSPDLWAVAWDENSDPAIAVIVGNVGTILYSTDREYVDGFQVYTFEQVVPETYRNIFDIAFGTTSVGTSTPDRFMAAAGGGLIQFASPDNLTQWELVETGTTEDLYGLTYVTEQIWVAVGRDATVMRTTDHGENWSDITNPATEDLYAVELYDGTLAAVGAGGEVIVSTNDGANWTAKTSGVTSDLRDLIYGPGAWFIVGSDSTILETSDFSSFSVRTSPVVSVFRGIAYSGTGGLMVAVGEDSSTITSTVGTIWEGQDPGIESVDLLGIGYGDNRFVSVGEDAMVAYSATGAGRPAFDLFEPISDIYRAQCFCRHGGYMAYGGLMIFDEGEWRYYANRFQVASPGTVDDFTSVGWFFADLPTTGTLMDMASITGGILIAETNQLSFAYETGNFTAPFGYRDNYGEGIKPISNLTAFNGVGYVVADDGLIYAATSTGVGRLPGFFDLTKFEDWEPGEESVWLGFDPIYQTLFVFRQKSPWTVYLINDDTGGVSEMALPEITIEGVAYEPRSCFTVEGLRSGLHISYASTGAAASALITARLDLDGPITGVDEPTSGVESRHRGDFQTGSFRLVSLGGRGEINEVVVRTWADDGSTSRPDVAVLVKEESDDEWQTNEMPTGTITVHQDGCSGVGTAWSRYIVKG